MKSRRGFTLIELLVVIAIIGILASIMFPVFSAARENARKTVCLSNMHQLAMAIAMQSIDDGNYPGDNWANSTQSYVKNQSVYTCPSDPLKKTTKLSYEINEWLSGQSESIVRDTSSTVILIESGVDNGIFETGPVVESTVIPLLSASYPATSIPNPMNALHNGSANVLYADSHGKSARYGQITAGMFFP